MFRLVVRALPARADDEGRVDALGRVQRPVVDDFGILLVGSPLLAVDVEAHVREVNLESVVMPFVVAYLTQLPAPLGRSEDVRIALGKVTSQQEYQSAISDEQSVVVSVHFCRKTIDYFLTTKIWCYRLFRS